MSRKVLTGVAIDLAKKSALSSADSTVYLPEFVLGTQVLADSGVYIYMQANGAIAEGYIAKFIEGTWDADTITTAESGTTNTPLGVCVASGGLADNQHGWFWRGAGSEYVYVESTVAAADTQLLTSSTAGKVDDSTNGTDPIHDLFNVAAVSSTGLNLCRSTSLLSVNATITN